MPTLASRFLEHARRHPDRACVHVLRAGHDDLTLSYGALAAAAARHGAWLTSHGVERGDVVVLVMAHGEALVSAYWGCVLAGAVPSILPALSEKLSPDKYRDDMGALLSITRPSALVSDAATIAVCGLDQLADRVRVLDAAGCPPGPVPLVDPAEQNEDAIALLQHSSGSTGLQKGVALSHRAIFNQLDAYAGAIRLTEADTIASWLPLYHDMGLVACFLMPVLCGVPVAMMSPFDWVRAPARLMQVIARYHATLCWLPNFAFNFMANPARARDRDLAGVRLDTVRAFVNCSEPTYATSHARFAARFASYGLRAAALTTCYAMAENVFAVSQAGFDGPVGEDVVDRAALMNARVALRPAGEAAAMVQLSQGRPLPNVRVAVLDEARSVLPDRHVGELAVHSDCMLEGYFNRPDLNERAFVSLQPDSAGTARNYYLTGDLGYLADGQVFVTGRKKDLIIVGGKNVYPQDLEQLATEVPGVHPGRVVAFGALDEAAGTEEVVVLAESDATDPDEMVRIADALRAHLTRNTDVAVRRVEMQQLGTLIKTSSGKIARAANKELYLQRSSTMNV